ncbi:hypothetical protein ACF0H5_019219 [Mactra antiquata]
MNRIIFCCALVAVLASVISAQTSSSSSGTSLFSGGNFQRILPLMALTGGGGNDAFRALLFCQNSFSFLCLAALNGNL